MSQVRYVSVLYCTVLRVAYDVAYECRTKEKAREKYHSHRFYPNQYVTYVY